MRLQLALLLTLSSTFAFSQEYKRAITIQAHSIPQRNNHNYNPFEGTWDEEKDLYTGPNISVQDKSFSTGISYQQHYKDNISFRVRAGIIRTSINSRWNYNDAVFSYEYRANKKQLDYFIAPGTVMLFNMMRFKYYLGAEIPVTLYGPSAVQKYYAYYNIASGEKRYSSDLIGSYSNGWSAGIGSFGGFGYIYRNITFGPEAGFAFMYSDYGRHGVFSTAVENGTSYAESAEFTKNYSSFGITGIYGSLNLSVWF